MKYLLDTTACIDVLRGRKDVITTLKEKSPEDCALSVIAYYALLSGAQKCTHPDREQAKIDHFINAIHFLPFDRPAARESARIRFALENQGNRIGAYDTLIAGHAVAGNLIVVTSNVSEFIRVDSLIVEDWRT